MERRLLTEAQQRHLRVYFSGLLAEAEEYREWVRGLSRAEAPWASELSLELEVLARSIRAAAAQLELDVERVEVDPTRVISSWASTWWADILECRPESLRGYGAVQAELERALGPAVDEIAACLVRIGSMAKANPGTGGA